MIPIFDDDVSAVVVVRVEVAGSNPFEVDVALNVGLGDGNESEDEE